LQFCDDNGIPHSTFLEWEDTDRAKALAFILEKGSKCHMCGTAPWEWDEKQGGSKYAYEAVGVQCPGCYQKAISSDDTSQLPGVTIELRPTGTQESAQRYVKQKRRDAARRAAQKKR
jgi:hypothetical protein